MSTNATRLPAACASLTIRGMAWLYAARYCSSEPLVDTTREATRTVASGAAAVIWLTSDFSRSVAVET